MKGTRLEAFSDGVIAILITILVLEFKAPEGDDLEALLPLLPTFLAYVLSFVFLGIYWNNHHHTMHLVTHVNGKILWANLHLLFWLSTVPFVTAWLGHSHFAPVPTAAYGIVMLMCGLSRFIMSQAVIAHQGPDSKLRVALGRDLKGKASGVLCLLAIGLAFVQPWMSDVVYVVVVCMWLVPDQRLEVMFKS